jgi:3-phenylpropionate/trans-cinnamate dioxygenase ferredoxin component
MEMIYMSFVEIAKIDELENGEMKLAKLNGIELLLARIGNIYYCSNNSCPHMGGNLSLGKLEGTIITCPRHHSQFDLTDGSVIRWTDFTGFKKSIGKVFKSPRPLKIYQVKVEGEKILINI